MFDPDTLLDLTLLTNLNGLLESPFFFNVF